MPTAVVSHGAPTSKIMVNVLAVDVFFKFIHALKRRRIADALFLSSTF